MPKRKPKYRVRSYGIYTKWDSNSKDLPRIQQFTTDVPATLDIEFGLILQIEGAKNEILDYCIYHPDIPDDDGNIRAPFDGQVYVKSNDWNFYLGDTIWEPIDTKLGDWRMTIEFQGKIIAEKTFHVSLPDHSSN